MERNAGSLCGEESVCLFDDMKQGWDGSLVGQPCRVDWNLATSEELVKLRIRSVCKVDEQTPFGKSGTVSPVRQGVAGASRLPAGLMAGATFFNGRHVEP